MLIITLREDGPGKMSCEGGEMQLSIFPVGLAYLWKEVNRKAENERARFSTVNEGIKIR